MCTQKKLIGRYLSLNEAEKKQDYYISLGRENYFANQFKDNKDEFIKKINEYNRTQILEFTDELYCGKEIVEIINTFAKSNGMSFIECVDDVYLAIALDMSLHDYRSIAFIENKYKGKIYEFVDSNILNKLETSSEKDIDLSDMWNTTENYYRYLDDMYARFYEFLKKIALEEVDFQ